MVAGGAPISEMPVNAPAVVSAMIECACDWIVRSWQELFMFLVDYNGEMDITSAENH